MTMKQINVLIQAIASPHTIGGRVDGRRTITCQCETKREGTNDVVDRTISLGFEFMQWKLIKIVHALFNRANILEVSLVLEVGIFLIAKHDERPKDQLRSGSVP